MREILFRGKSIHTDEWVYGYFYECKMPYGEHATIISTEDVENDWDEKEQVHYHVDRKTVGQFTGELDRNHCKTFEGDIVQGFEYNAKIGNLDTIIFQAGKFKLKHTPEDLIAFTYPLSKYACEVIGNIHDNPELLNVT